MSTSVLACLTLWLLTLPFTHSQSYGTCDQPYAIFSHATATTDSNRDCQSAYSIFPELTSAEDSDKFNDDGQCASQCQIVMPHSCWKIFAPQTQYDEGYLHVKTLESKMSEKWQNAVDKFNDEYDAFFDFNVAFWVNDLDLYLEHWRTFSEENEGEILETLGIEWTLPEELADTVDIDDDEYQNDKFYSILVHSPGSQLQFEFMSYTVPTLYDDVKWISSNVPRCTFQLQNDPYPWDRMDGATIIPVRISHATTDTNQLYNFYSKIMEADLLYHYHTEDVQGRPVKTVFMHLEATHIEVQFVQRAVDSTFGEFTLEEYESLLMRTHDTVMTSPFCGQDRWMDNHFGYSTWTVPGLTERIYFNLHSNDDIKYSVLKNKYESESMHIKAQLNAVGFEGQYTYGLRLIEPTGQVIAVGGVISENSDPHVAYFAPMEDPAECLNECEFGLHPGKVNPLEVYGSMQGMLNPDGSLISDGQREKTPLEKLHDKNFMISLLVGGGVIFVLFVGMIYYFICVDKQTCHDYVNYVPIE